MSGYREKRQKRIEKQEETLMVKETEMCSHEPEIKSIFYTRCL